MNEISFMSANFVARELGYRMKGGWGEGDRATNERFRPVETFPERFDGLLREVRAMGFGAIDLWTGHLNWAWATDEHVAAAHELLNEHGLAVTSLAGGFGSTRDELEAACELAVAVGTKTFSGSVPLLESDRGAVVEALSRHDLRLGLENHPEKTPEEMLERIGDGGGGRIGTALDTGWYGTQGYDAARAIRELEDHLFGVHLKDVRAVGTHETCRYGEGVVPIEGCVRTLEEVGYGGAISVEHEPEDFDPTEDCEANLRMLETWLGR